MPDQPNLADMTLLQLFRLWREKRWSQHRTMDGSALYCVLCNYVDGVTEGAHLVVDGCSLCAEHAEAVINRGDNIWFDMNDRFSLRGTIKGARNA